MKVKIIERAPAHVAYLRHTGPYGAPISRFWQQIVAPWLEENGLLDAPRYGISHDDPGVTAPEKCRYDAAAEVPQDFRPGGKALCTTIPGGRYAVLEFNGPVSEIGEAWTALLRDWLPGSGMQLDARPCFEFYPRGAKMDPKTGAFECQIVVPVAPL